MIEFGRTLREAREAKGWTVSQLAEQTRVMHQIVEGLEKEDFSRIVAPIYGRGFVKIISEALGLEAKPLVDEFMEIYSGNRPPSIRLKDVTLPPPDAAAYDTPVPPQAMPQPVMSDPKPPRREFKMPSMSLPDVPVKVWRVAVLAVAVAAVLAGLVFGLRALYSATTPAPEGAEVPAAATSDASDAKTSGTAGTAEPAKAAGAVEAESPAPSAPGPREKVAVPPLYID